ncbi:MAG: hypothetical protein ACE5G0_13855 [Rhodothermales bacterium]
MRSTFPFFATACCLLVLVGLGMILLPLHPLYAVSEPGDGECAVAHRGTDPPAYYQIDLVSTKRLPGTRQAKGVSRVTFATSPFGVAISPEGSYVYTLELSIEHLAPASQGAYVAWVSTPSLDKIKPLGTLDAQMRASGRVAWNKFLVIITLEPSADALGETWQGPVVLRGMSRSGMMHTMAGHGPFQQEPCAAFGYD